jgi:hypothetical protein
MIYVKYPTITFMQYNLLIVKILGYVYSKQQQLLCYKLTTECL